VARARKEFDAKSNAEALEAAMKIALLAPKRLYIFALEGQIDYDPQYNYKAARQKRPRKRDGGS
jgi:hypothetical protein